MANYFTGWAGLQLFYSCQKSKIAAKGVVIIAHGYGEHSGRYNHFVDYLTEEGFTVYAFDHRGHGKSEGFRADVVRFTDYVKDLATFVDLVLLEEPTLPLFLFGQSTGAVIVTIYAAEHKEKIRGLITSAIYIKDPEKYDPILVKIAPIANFFFPLLPVQELNPGRQSKDPAVIEAFKADPLCYNGRVRVRMGVHFLNMSKYIVPVLPKVSAPALILHGGSDLLASPESSRIVYEGIVSEDKTLRIFDGLYHELLNEPEKADVMEEIGGWIKSRV